MIFRDISERKSAEQALRRSEGELSEFFENATVGLHWVGPDGTILRANRTELELLGYARDEYIGRHIAEFHVDREIIDDILRRLQAGQELREYEARMRRKDGSIKHVLINSNVRWEDGKFIHTRCFTRDITDRKRVDEAQARLATIVESSQDAIISTTIDNEILSWNAGAERLLGYSAAEVIGRPAVLLHPANRQDEERVILERLHRGERIEPYETVRLSKQGERIDVSLTVSPIFDGTGRVIGASKIARDITANKRAQQRLIMQNGVTRALAESATLNDAASQILSAICEPLGWDVGAIWYVDQHDKALRCSEVWHAASVQIPQFESSCRELTFQIGIGLPGRVWSSANATWIPDVVKDTNFPRAPIAGREGLRSAFAFPIVLNDEVLGVIEFFSREISQPDEDLLQMMTNVGSQIGQFIERKRAEEALRDSGQRFRLMAETIPSVIWTASPDGAITYANERWYEYCGLTPEQNAEWPKLVLHPDDYRRCVISWNHAVQQGSEYEIEVRNRRHDGAYRWFVTRATPLRDDSGAIVQWFGTSTDIDDRKRAEQSSRFLADASATLAEPIDYRSTLQRVAGLAVPAFADWCAVDMLEPDGTIRRLAVTHTDPAKVKLAHEIFRRYPPQRSDSRGIMNVLSTGEPEWMAVIDDSFLIDLAQDEEHLKITRQLGLKSYICVPLRSRTGTLGALSFVTAESGRIYDETDLAAAEDLADRAAIAIENANLLATLKEGDQRKDEFLAMLAHELRNPLAPIRNAVQIFRRAGPPAPELRSATEVIDRQVHQMTRLVDDLLDVSRITRGKIELRKERVELAAIVNSAVEASRPIIEKWRHDLIITLPPQTIPLDADATRLAQVLSNLLNNAAKYTDYPGRIWLTAEQHGDHVLISVKDTGIGIPVEMLPRVFDMFTQVDRSLERAEGGLGIGLTLVHRLVEMHRGTVEAHSDGADKGSEFIVSLPVATGAVDRVAQERSREDEKPVTPVTRRILVVDDNLDSAESLVMLLGMIGNEVHTAHDGLEAVEAATAHQPDIILMDIGLPKLNGYEAARRIRAEACNKEMVLVALTGWGQEEDRRRSEEAGFDHHLTKPVDFDILQKLLADTSARRPKGQQESR